MKPLLSYCKPTVQRKTLVMNSRIELCNKLCMRVYRKRCLWQALSPTSCKESLWVVSFLCATALVSCIIKRMPRFPFKSTFSVWRVRGGGQWLTYHIWGMALENVCKLKTIFFPYSMAVPPPNPFVSFVAASFAIVRVDTFMHSSHHCRWKQSCVVTNRLVWFKSFDLNHWFKSLQKYQINNWFMTFFKSFCVCWFIWICLAGVECFVCLMHL